MPAVAGRSKSAWGFVATVAAGLLLKALPHLSAEDFRRGDANGDGLVDLGDAVFVLDVLHHGVEPPCERAADADGNGVLEFEDAIAVMSFVYLDGSAPPVPGPFDCGPGPDDALSCEGYSEATCASPPQRSGTELVSLELAGPSTLSERDHTFLGRFDLRVRLCSDVPIQAWQVQLALEGCSVWNSQLGPDADEWAVEYFALEFAQRVSAMVMLDFDPPYDGQTIDGCHSVLELTIETEDAPSECVVRFLESLDEARNTLVVSGGRVFKPAGVSDELRVDIRPALHSRLALVLLDTVIPLGASGDLRLALESEEERVFGVTAALAWDPAIAAGASAFLDDGLDAESFLFDVQDDHLAFSLVMESETTGDNTIASGREDLLGVRLRGLSPGETAVEFREGEFSLGAEPAIETVVRASSLDGPIPFKRVDGVQAIPARVYVVDTSGHKFLRGDADEDGALSITDPIVTLGYKFLGTFSPRCLDALDYNDDGEIDVSDAVEGLIHQFVSTSWPRAPGLTCGIDPTPGDPLHCLGHRRCRP